MDDGDGKQSSGDQSWDHDHITATSRSVWGPMFINNKTFANLTEAVVVLTDPAYAGCEEMIDYIKNL